MLRVEATDGAIEDDCVLNDDAVEEVAFCVLDAIDKEVEAGSVDAVEVELLLLPAVGTMH